MRCPANPGAPVPLGRLCLALGVDITAVSQAKNKGRKIDGVDLDDIRSKAAMVELGWGRAEMEAATKAVKSLNVILMKFFDDKEKHWTLVDGYPRTIRQAEMCGLRLRDLKRTVSAYRWRTERTVFGRGDPSTPYERISSWDTTPEHVAVWKLAKLCGLTWSQVRPVIVSTGLKAAMIPPDGQVDVIRPPDHSVMRIVSRVVGIGSMFAFRAESGGDLWWYGADRNGVIVRYACKASIGGLG